MPDKPHKECGIVGCKLLILYIYTKLSEDNLSSRFKGG